MGLLDNVKDYVRKIDEQMKAEEREFNQLLKPYLRGFDVYPQEVSEHFIGRLRRKLIGRLAAELLIMLGLTGLGVYMLVGKKDSTSAVGCWLFALILLPFVSANISTVSRTVGDRFDVFGAMVTHRKVEREYSTDSHGKDVTVYNRYLWLNGVKCDVTDSDYRKLDRGVYCYFIRLKGKYIKSDIYYFYPTDPGEEEHRIAQYYPNNDDRLDRPSKPGTAASLILALGVLGSFGSGMFLMVQRKIQTFHWGILAGFLVMTVIGIIARRVSIDSADTRHLANKRKRAGMK